MGNGIANIEKRIYDSSCMSDFLHCPKLFYWRWVRTIVPKEESPALVFGRIWHDAMYIWYTTGDAEKAKKVFETLPKFIADDRRTAEHGKVIFEQYVERWGKEDWETLYLEKEFIVDMGSGKMYAGRIDKICKWNGMIYPLDHKTTAQLGSYFFAGFRPSVQMDGYCYATRELCGSCAGMIINGISIAANPKERFGRDISTRTPMELDRFPVQFDIWTKWIETAMLTKEFPLYYTHCSNFGKCPYWELCVYGEDERTIEMKFKQDTVEEVKR